MNSRSASDLPAVRRASSGVAAGQIGPRAEGDDQTILRHHQPIRVMDRHATMRGITRHAEQFGTEGVDHA